LNSSPFALGFYESQGYERKREKEDYQGIPMYYMEKVLS
jgi:hypothetical protein